MTESITIAGREFTVTHDQPTTEDFETPYLLTPKVKRGAQANYPAAAQQAQAAHAVSHRRQAHERRRLADLVGAGSLPRRHSARVIYGQANVAQR